MTLEKVKGYYGNFLENSRILSGDRITSKIVDSDDGFPVIHSHVKTPIGFSARSNIKVQYVWEEEDGSHIYMESSQFTDDLVTKHKKVIKKDVLAPVIMNYAKYTPCDGGVKIEVVICIGMGGSVPTMV